MSFKQHKIERKTKLLSSLTSRRNWT